MEQYIEREKFLKKSAECFGHFGVLIKAIEEIANECTTADVVPKSDGAMHGGSFYFNLEEIEERGKRLMAEHDAEVAREIFEEIERETKNHGITYAQRKIAELKKKYTEGKQ